MSSIKFEVTLHNSIRVWMCKFIRSTEKLNRFKLLLIELTTSSVSVFNSGLAVVTKAHWHAH